MKRLALIIVFVSAWLAAAAAPADTVASIVNFYPGPVFYELEGHTVLRIQYPDGRDIAYSWGHFDFNTDDFVYRFVKGETDYSGGASDWQWFRYFYERDGRRAVEHRLAFTPEQTRRLVALVEDNMRPENRVYRYNYVKDNCATRPLRLVELAAGDTIFLAEYTLPDSGRQLTFRNVMRHYHAHYPWYQFGIDLALGAGIDYELDNREAAFAPTVLDGQLPGATIGGKVPLVAERRVILDFPPDYAVEPPTPWYLTPMAVALLVLALSVAFTVRDWHRRRVTRWFDALLFGIFGLAGGLLTFLVFISVHEATSPNWLLAWLNPLCLIPTVFIWLKKCKRLVYCYQIANFAALLALCLAWPWLPQSANAAFWPLLAADALRAFSYIRLTRNEL